MRIRRVFETVTGERSRALAARSLVGLVAFVALLTAAAELGRRPYFELATHFRLQYAIAAALAALALAALGKRAVALLALACALANGAYVAPYFGSASPVAMAAGPSARVRLMLANVYLGNSDYDALLSAVRDESPDVLVLQEVTRPWWAHLDALRAEYPYYNAIPRQGGSGIALFSRVPLDEVEILTFGTSPWPGMFARLEVEGRPVSVLTLHPPTPMRRDKFQARNSQFAAAAARLRDTRGPKVLIGDLNTTPWSPYYADLVRDAGLRDPRLGVGLWTTWPMPMPAFLRIPIDHCLTSEDVRVESIHTGGRTGSDHRPLVVDLAVSAPTR